MTKNKLNVQLFERSHIRKEFSCGNIKLDNYIKDRATQDHKHKIAVTYVLLRGSIIIGYYTLSSYSIKSSIIPESIKKKLPNYGAIPTTLLGRLAVDSQYQGRGYGEHLLMHSMETSFNSSSSIASMALCVDAIDDAAKEFYKKYDFIEFNDSASKLFIPMKVIARNFQEKKQAHLAIEVA